MVRRHYFRPGREDFHTVITQAMPKVLGIWDSKPTAKKEMKRIRDRSTNRTWSADRNRLLELVEALQAAAGMRIVEQKTVIDGVGVFRVLRCFGVRARTNHCDCHRVHAFTGW